MKKQQTVNVTFFAQFGNWFAKDLVYLTILVVFSIFLCYNLFLYEHINTGYGDWIAHAYRVKTIQSDGFLTWIHDWYCGYPLWQSYQFVPHLITAFFSTSLGWSVTRTMCILSGFLFIFLRFELYAACRLLKFSPEASFIAALISLSISSFWFPLKDFSYLWGVAFFPFTVFLCYEAFFRDRFKFSPGLFSGFAFYLHPLLAFVSILSLIIIGIQKGRWKLLLQNILLLLLVSGFYLVPAFLSDRPPYIDPWHLSTPWMRSMFPTFLFGLSLSLIVAFAVAFMLRGRISGFNRELFNFVSAVLAVLIFFVFIIYVGYLPTNLFNYLQATRWMPFIGILLCVLTAFLIENFIVNRKIIFLKRYLIFTAVIIVLMVEAQYITVHESPGFVNVWRDDMSEWILNHESQVNYSTRIYTTGTPYVSFFAFGHARFTDGYYHQNYNILYDTLNWLILSEEPFAPVSQQNFTLIEPYLKVFGVSHLLLSNNLPFTEALKPGGVFEGKLTIVDQAPGFTVFKTPWEPRQAFCTSISHKDEMFFPNLRWETDEERMLKDRLVVKFAEIMYLPETVAVYPEYPSQEEITVKINDLPQGSYLVLSESYDGSWHCTINDSKARIEKIGPNYIGIDLSSFAGDITVQLRHEVHWTWIAGLVLSFLSIPTFAICKSAKLQKRLRSIFWKLLRKPPLGLG